MNYINGKTLIWGAFLTGSFSVLYFAIPSLTSVTYDSSVSNEKAQVVLVKDEESIKKAEPKFVATHIKTPDTVKGVYMSACAAATPSFRNKIVKLIEETELNSVVIDVKDYSGTISFVTDNPLLANKNGGGCISNNMKEFVASLHEKQIYVIARITVFQDPYYTKIHPELAVKKDSNKNTVWKDYKGISYIDAGARDFWEYIAELSRESYSIGFDEINYDYLRFPSDGNMKDIYYPFSEEKIISNPTFGKAKVIQNFAEYINRSLSDTGAVLSADLFGYTTTNADDLGIGQVLERALPYFDYVMPMVYPSHYNPGFIGISKPAQKPYEVVNYSMRSAVTRANKLKNAVNTTSTTTKAVYLRTLAKSGNGNISANQLRPWLQDFNLGAIYTPEMVRIQIQATYDAGLKSWVLWDAANTYTREALLEE
jgi:hypothetical protein